MDRPRVALVIPAWNEAASISAVVKAASRYGTPVVVDDGSSDQTAELARQAGAVVVLHQTNQGYDAALNSGFKRAAELGAEIIITLDADGQHDPTLLEQFIRAIDAGADVVIGTRDRRQRVAEHIFACYTRLRFGISDPLCGMKAYRKEVYAALGHFDSWSSVGTELMIFAAKRGYRLNQIPFITRRRQGNSRFGAAISGNYKILRAMVCAAIFVR